MVSREPEILCGVDYPPGFSGPRGGLETGCACHSTTGVSLGIDKRAWTSLLRLLSIPHFSYSKRLNLTHETKIPIIFDDACIQPRLLFSYPIFIRTLCQEPSKRIATHECQQCYESQLRYNHRKDVVICTHCGHEDLYAETYQYRRASRHILVARKLSPNFYKRVVHFRFWLRRLQGKEPNHVTHEVIENVKTLLMKDNSVGINYWNVRNAMKRLHYERFYRNTIYIMSCIRGKPLVNLTKRQEDVLIKMFIDIQESFCAIGHARVNMLNYPYVIKKLCELKRWHGMARVVPMLKSNVRIVLQDELWKKICSLKKWTFIPTAQWTTLDTRSPSCKAH